jgi:hypothetical protein
MATKNVVTGDRYYEIDGKLSEIKRQLRQPSGYPFDVDQLSAALQAISEGKFGEIAGHKRGNASVRVDTTLGLKGLLDALGAKDWTGGDILSPKWNPPPILNRGTYESDVEFLELGQDMTTSEIEAMVAVKDGYRLALPEETLAACAKDKDAQRKGPIVCVGAFWVNPHRDRRALVLSGSAGERRVDLYWDYPEDRWDGRCRVAVVRKSST